jgi:hypothetical protein
MPKVIVNIPSDLECDTCHATGSQSITMQQTVTRKKQPFARVITICDCGKVEYYWCPIIDDTTTLDNAGKVPF